MILEHKQDIELFILKLLVQYPHNFKDTKLVLKPEYFDVYREYFIAISELHKKGDVLNFSSLYRYNEKFDNLTLMRICTGDCTDIHFDYNCSLLIDQYASLQFRTILSEYVAKAQYHNGLDLQAELRKDLEKLENVTNVMKEDKLTDLLNESVKNAENRSKIKSYVSTDLHILDKNLDGGFQNSDLVIVAARPSVGKTAFTLFLSKKMSRNRKVLFVSIEMKKNKLVDRLILSETKVDTYNFKTGNLDANDYSQLEYAINSLSTCNLVIKDDCYSIQEVELAIKREMPDLVVIDYLGMIRGYEELNNRNLQLGYFTKDLKRIAKQCNIPILCLSQLNREVSKRGDKRPTLTDLRDSGEIEQDADLVIFLHRDDYFNNNDKDYIRTNELEVICAKNRDGKVFSQVFKHDETQRNYFETDFEIDFMPNSSDEVYF